LAGNLPEHVNEKIAADFVGICLQGCIGARIVCIQQPFQKLIDKRLAVQLDWRTFLFVILEYRAKTELGFCVQLFLKPGIAVSVDEGAHRTLKATPDVAPIFALSILCVSAHSSCSLIEKECDINMRTNSDVGAL